MMISLEAAKEYVLAGAKNGGVICPCCGRLCKVYKRKLNSGIAYGLLWLVQKYRGVPVAVQYQGPRRVLTSREMGKLVHWDLAYLMDKAPEDTKRKTSGMWSPTEKGQRFVKDPSVTVPKHVYLYLNVVQRFSVDETNIVNALGDRFDYKQLMDALTDEGK